jgi:hypothetical protein
MDLDVLYTLLAIGAASPYVAEAALTWMQRTTRHSRCRSLGSLMHPRSMQ